MHFCICICICYLIFVFALHWPLLQPWPWSCNGFPSSTPTLPTPLLFQEMEFVRPGNRDSSVTRPICFSVDLKRGIKFSRMADDVLIESLRATCLDSALNPFSSSVFVFHYWIQSWVLFKPLMVHERIIMINWRGSYWVAGNLRWAEEEQTWNLSGPSGPAVL